MFSVKLRSGLLIALGVGVFLSSVSCVTPEQKNSGQPVLASQDPYGKKVCPFETRFCVQVFSPSRCWTKIAEKEYSETGSNSCAARNKLYETLCRLFPEITQNQLEPISCEKKG